jgi:hypothetical protein
MDTPIPRWEPLGPEDAKALRESTERMRYEARVLARATQIAQLAGLPSAPQNLIDLVRLSDTPRAVVPPPIDVSREADFEAMRQEILQTEWGQEQEAKRLEREAKEKPLRDEIERIHGRRNAETVDLQEELGQLRLISYAASLGGNDLGQLDGYYDDDSSTSNINIPGPE